MRNEPIPKGFSVTEEDLGDKALSPHLKPGERLLANQYTVVPEYAKHFGSSHSAEKQPVKVLSAQQEAQRLIDTGKFESVRVLPGLAFQKDGKPIPNMSAVVVKDKPRVT